LVFGHQSADISREEGAGFTPAPSTGERRDGGATAHRLDSSLFAALRHRNFRLYWLGQLIAVVGQTMEWVALPWLVFELTNSPISLGVTGLAQTIPRVCFTLLGGAVADRWDRQRLTIAGQGLSALLFFGLAALTVTQLVSLWHALAIAFLLGCVRAFEGPGRNALLPQVVAREDLANAMALSNISWEAPRLVGPALAGALIGFIGIGPTLFAGALGLAVSMVFFALMQVERPRAGQQGGTGHFWDTVLEGFGFIMRSPFLSVLIGLTFFNSVFGMSYQILLPVFARDILGVGAQGLGLLAAMSGGGAVVGSFVAASLAQTDSRGPQIILGAMGFGLIVVAFAVSPWFPLSLGLLFIAGFTSTLYLVGISTAIQLHIPDEYRARVMGVWGLTWSLAPLGGTIAGPIAEYYGAPLAVSIGGFLVTGMAVVVALKAPWIRRIE
jgi:MFS family permease